MNEQPTVALVTGAGSGIGLALVDQLPERSLQITKPFFLATQGFSLSASTVRDVYLAGETFELTVNAADAEGGRFSRAANRT